MRESPASFQSSKQENNSGMMCSQNSKRMLGSFKKASRCRECRLCRRENCTLQTTLRVPNKKIIVEMSSQNSKRMLGGFKKELDVEKIVLYQQPFSNSELDIKKRCRYESYYKHLSPEFQAQ